MGEIEAEPIRVDQRPGLLHMFAQHLAQSGLQQMGGSVIVGRALTPTFRHLEFDGLAKGQAPFHNLGLMENKPIPHSHGIFHPTLAVRPEDHAPVTALPA